LVIDITITHWTSFHGQEKSFFCLLVPRERPINRVVLKFKIKTSSPLPIKSVSIMNYLTIIQN